jgi:hypothetical protein
LNPGQDQRRDEEIGEPASVHSVDSNHFGANLLSEMSLAGALGCTFSAPLLSQTLSFASVVG